MEGAGTAQAIMRQREEMKNLRVQRDNVQADTNVKQTTAMLNEVLARMNEANIGRITSAKDLDIARKHQIEIDNTLKRLELKHWQQLMDMSVAGKITFLLKHYKLTDAAAVALAWGIEFGAFKPQQAPREDTPGTPGYTPTPSGETNRDALKRNLANQARAEDYM